MSVQLCSGIGQYEYTKVEIWPHIKRVFSIETNLYLKNWFQIFEQKFHFFVHNIERLVVLTPKVWQWSSTQPEAKPKLTVLQLNRRQN